MSIEDRALKALRSLMKEIGPGGRATKIAQDIRDRAERASVRLMDEVVSRIADRRVRTTGRRPWEAPEQIEAPKRPADPSWRSSEAPRTEDLFQPGDVVGSVEGSRPSAPATPHTNTAASPTAAPRPVQAAPIEPAPVDVAAVQVAPIELAPVDVA
ncbi:hypothetical protein L6R52_04340, partial [Myxococcota bacterium]|nr:hypothetical protein [Myxococcota bacterium]